jgi:hypothetical protein
MPTLILADKDRLINLDHVQVATWREKGTIDDEAEGTFSPILCLQFQGYGYGEELRIHGHHANRIWDRLREHEEGLDLMERRLDRVYRMAEDLRAQITRLTLHADEIHRELTAPARASDPSRYTIRRRKDQGQLDAHNLAWQTNGQIKPKGPEAPGP